MRKLSQRERLAGCVSCRTGCFAGESVFMEMDQIAKSSAAKKAIAYGRWEREALPIIPVMADRIRGVVNWARYRAMDSMGMTVTAAALPAF